MAPRWDDEKQPLLYGFSRSLLQNRSDVEFAIFCGQSELKSNDPWYVKRAMDLQDAWDLGKTKTANFRVYTVFKKNDYYNLLADSKVLFNCALQDWVSNTVSEADTMGTLIYIRLQKPQKCLQTTDTICMYSGALMTQYKN